VACRRAHLCLSAVTPRADELLGIFPLSRRVPTLFQEFSRFHAACRRFFENFLGFTWRADGFSRIFPLSRRVTAFWGIFHRHAA